MVLIGTAVFGIVVREIVSSVDSSWIAGVVNEGGRLSRVSDWVVVPDPARGLGRADLVRAR